jgi:hypothetical protein
MAAEGARRWAIYYGRACPELRYTRGAIEIALDAARMKIRVLEDEQVTS